MKTNRKGAQVGCDCHRLFSSNTPRDQDGRIIWRQRLDPDNRVRLRRQLSDWPAGTPVIMEGTFGWGRLLPAFRPSRSGQQPAPLSEPRPYKMGWLEAAQTFLETALADRSRGLDETSNLVQVFAAELRFHP